MQSWKNFSAQLPAVDVSAVSKNFRNTVQATRCVLSFSRTWDTGTDICVLFFSRVLPKSRRLDERERLGNVGAEGITE